VNATPVTSTAPVTPRSSEGLSTIRRRTIQILIVVALVQGIFTATFSYFEAPDLAVLLLVTMSVFALAYGVLLVLTQAGRLNIAAHGLALTLLTALILGGGSTVTLAVILTVTVAMLIANVRMYFVYNILTFGGILLSNTLFVRAILENFLGQSGTLVDQSSTVFYQDAVTNVALVVALVGVSVSVRYFRRALFQFFVDAESNANLLRVSSEVGQVTAGITSLDDLLPQAVNYIRDRLGYYHVQIFLVNDTGEVALLRASTGEVGQQLLARKHQLNVGSESVIGRVTLTGEPLNYTDTSAQGVHYRNELLPDTRSELALPIRDGERIIGALDVQSVEPNAFGQNQIQSLQIMTNLLAAGIRNARLFQDQQENVQENQRLYIETQANLREIQRLNRQLTKESWEQFTKERAADSGVTVEGNRLSQDNTWTRLLQQAGQTRQTIVETEGRLQIAVPILLRGEVIGALEVEPDEALDENDAIDIVRAVSERLAVSLDNARLFEESQETTLYEQRINQIVSQYQNASSVDELLQITLAELTETLGAQQGAIRLTAAPTRRDDDPAPPTNGHNGNGHRPGS